MILDVIYDKSKSFLTYLEGDKELRRFVLKYSLCWKQHFKANFQKNNEYGSKLEVHVYMYIPIFEEFPQGGY